MRICVFALALVALAQPAFARSHHHAHHARAYHAHYAHHYARAGVRLSQPGMVQAFVRTDATDRPFFSDHSPAVPLVLLGGGFVVTFASVVMGSAIMRLGQE